MGKVESLLPIRTPVIPQSADAPDTNKPGARHPGPLGS